MAGGGVGEAMLISAVVGGATSAATGGDPLKGALLGAATGGVGCWCCWCYNWCYGWNYGWSYWNYGGCGWS
jgi:hypothetical protein